MLQRFLGMFLLLAGLGVTAYFFQDILTFSQSTVVQREAQEAVKIGNWEKAIGIYEQGVRDNPSNVPIALKLAHLYDRAGQGEKSIELYKNIIKAKPDETDAYIGLAHALRKDPKRWNEAVDQLRIALKEKPKDARLLAQTGMLYKAASENPDETRESTREWLYKWAVYYYLQALKLNPMHFGSQFDLGVLYQNRNETQKAARHYCNALAIKPDSFEARYNLGLLLVDLDYLDEAYRQFERSVQILTEAGRIDEAQQMAQRVQNVKNTVYNNSSKRGLDADKPLPPYITEQCLQWEKAGEAKKAEE